MHTRSQCDARLVSRRLLLQVGLAAAGTAMSRRVSRAQPGATARVVEALTLDGGRRTLAAGALQDLAGALRGPLLLPRDDGYDQARRLASARFDRRPAFIVQATGAADAALAVTFARENHLLLSVKGGGHSDFGVSARDDAMMLDLSLLQGVRVDAQTRRAWVAGATLVGLIDHETGAQGLAVPLGGSPSVGIGGLALGGGLGRLGRRYGLTLDSIHAVDLICADGRPRRASPSDNPDLFWALRGGGGNFGVATAFELELHPIPDRVLAGSIFFPFSQLSRILKAYGEFSPEAPDDLYVELFLGVRANVETSVLQLNLCHLGDAIQADRILPVLRRFGRVVREDMTHVSYPIARGATAHAAARAPAAAPTRDIFWRSGFLSQLGNPLASILAEELLPDPDRHINMLFLQAGGAIGRTAPDATAFAHRGARHDMIFVASSSKREGAPPHAEAANRTWGRLKSLTSGFYVNDMAGGVTPTEVAVDYGANAARLAAVKARYDPGNLFRLNANIMPAPPARAHT